MEGNESDFVHLISQIPPLPIPALAMLEKEVLVRFTGVPAAADGPRGNGATSSSTTLSRLLSPPLAFGWSGWLTQ